MKKSLYTLPPQSSMIKVGNIKKYIVSKNARTGRSRKIPVLYTYKDIEYDIDGWADTNRFLPDDFDLVYLRLRREKTIPGWISGTTWMGLGIKKDDEVIFWKPKEEEKAA